MSETEKKSRSKGCGYGCLIALAVVFGMVAAVVVLVFAVASLGSFEGLEFGTQLGGASQALGQDEFPRMTEKWSSGSGSERVARIPVNGMIMLEQSAWGDRGAVTALRSIRRATHDPSVKAIILEINSGGGGITASDIIYKALHDFKKADESRRIVAIMGDVAASGAYYIALPADSILAHPTTVTGSIGVIMQSYNIKELAAKLGISDVTIKSGGNKDFFNPFQDVKPEQMAIMQRVISRMHDRFVTLVSENRGLSKDVVGELADGRVYLADEAVQNGLIDGIGYYQDAVAKTAELLGVDAVRVFRYEEQLTLADFFGGGPGIGLGLRHLLLGGGGSSSGLMYLWQPAAGIE
jgi:protease IV